MNTHAQCVSACETTQTDAGYQPYAPSCKIARYPTMRDNCWKTQPWLIDRKAIAVSDGERCGILLLAATRRAEYIIISKSRWLQSFRLDDSSPAVRLYKRTICSGWPWRDMHTSGKVQHTFCIKKYLVWTLLLLQQKQQLYSYTCREQSCETGSYIRARWMHQSPRFLAACANRVFFKKP